MSGLNPDGLGNTESFSAQDSESLSGEYDKLVDTAAEIESLPTDIQQGETVRIAQPDTPYVISSWSSGGQFGEIDVGGITVEWESTTCAEVNEPVIKVADNANIGGFWFGANSTIEDVTIRNYSFDGNGVETDADGKPVWDSDTGDWVYNQDQSVTNLDTFRLGDVHDWTLDCGVTKRSSPFHEHGTGGSLWIIGQETQTPTDGEITSVYGEWSGDRFLEFYAEDVDVGHAYGKWGYNRHLHYFPGCRRITVDTATARSYADTNMIGFAFDNTTDYPRDIVVNNATAIDLPRGVCFVSDVDSFRAGDLTAIITDDYLGGYPGNDHVDPEHLAKLDNNLEEVHIDSLHLRVSPQADDGSIPLNHGLRVTGGYEGNDDIYIGDVTFSGAYNAGDNVFRGLTYVPASGPLHIGTLNITGVGGQGAYVDGQIQIDQLEVSDLDGATGLEITANSTDSEINGSWPSLTDNGTRSRLNGKVELGGAPTGSNYGVEDDGLEILDTSVTPPDHYRVLQDGTVAGPL